MVRKEKKCSDSVNLFEHPKVNSFEMIRVTSDVSSLRFSVLMEVATLHQEQAFLRQQLEMERQRVCSFDQVGVTLLHVNHSSRVRSNLHAPDMIICKPVSL